MDWGLEVRMGVGGVDDCSVCDRLGRTGANAGGCVDGRVRGRGGSTRPLDRPAALASATHPLPHTAAVALDARAAAMLPLPSRLTYPSAAVRCLWVSANQRPPPFAFFG